MRSFRQLVKPVPQPYKKWLARFVLVVTLIPSVAIVGAIDAAKWLGQVAEEVWDGWKDVARW